MPRAAFERRDRLATSSATLDELEERWWNEHAALIERLWALPEDVRILLRQDFAKRARAFFGRGRVLELACGTGWPGRMIAGDGLRIVGIDLSREQIELARAEAGRAGLADVCEYRQGDISELPDGSFDGALVHAGLHHLADDEVEGFLDRLATFRPGFKVLLYEPVYPIRARLPWPVRAAGRATAELLVRLAMPRVPAGEFDHAAAARLDEVIRASTEAGWFFSPKEVPFNETWLLNALRSRLTLVRAYPCHFRSIEVAQRIALITDPKRRRHAVARNLRSALLIDRLLLASRVFRFDETRYVFYAYELLTRG
jgi:SAM-dependent methyltransferase